MKTDQRSHFQTLDSSCRSSAKIKEIRSKCTDQGKPIKDAISKLWTVPVVKCTDQGKPIKESISNLDQGKPIKEAISKLWTVPVDQGNQVKVHRSRETDQRSHFQTSAQIKVRRSRKTDQRIHFQTGIKHCTHYTRIMSW